MTGRYLLQRSTHVSSASTADDDVRGTMGKKKATTQELLEELMQRPESRERRIELLRELVRRDEELPDEMLDQAMRKLLDLLIR